MASNTVMVKEEELFAFCSAILRNAGMPDADADYAAKCVVQTNLWGTDSHGVIRLPAYVKRLQNGAVNPKPHIRTVSEFGAIARLHGDDGLGYVVAHEAMSKAIALAKVHGMGFVSVCHSNHFGAAGLFAREAAKEGMIAISMSNVYVNMAVPGSQKAVMGNHPIAFAIPMLDMQPFVLDFCLSQVALGKLMVAKDKGEKIPMDWAVDKDGNPTDDPAAGIVGAMLPMAGHKGYGLALVVEMLTGLFSGGAILDGIKGMVKDPEAPGETSQSMLVINPLAVMSREEWKVRAHTLYDLLKATPMREGAVIVFPGEPENATEAKRKKEGIPLPVSTVETLNALGAKYSLKIGA